LSGLTMNCSTMSYEKHNNRILKEECSLKNYINIFFNMIPRLSIIYIY